MFGYMTAKQAMKEGYTHHGSYYGIPIWMNDDEDEPTICMKWAPMDFIFTLFVHIEQFINANFYSYDEPCFMFKKGKPINE